jgi:hypothetical protein
MFNTFYENSKSSDWVKYFGCIHCVLFPGGIPAFSRRLRIITKAVPGTLSENFLDMR